MKKRKTLDRVLAALLAGLLITLSLPLSLFASAAETETVKAPPTELSALSDYVKESESVVKEDCYGNAVSLHFYYDSARTYTASETGKNGSTMILYLMNTGIVRIGQKSDAEIVRGMLDRGYYVIVADYSDVSLVSPDFDFSVQSIGQLISDGKLKTPNKPSDSQRITSIFYPVPAGYDIAYGIPYFSYDKHGAAGTLKCIVEIWNNDFRSVKRNSIVKWVYEDGTRKTTKPVADGYDVWYADAAGKTVDQENGQYTKIGNTWANTLTDCVKPDGSFIDLDLCMDVIYPTTVEGGEELSVPVMTALNSSYTRANMWLIDHRPQPLGFLAAGYAVVISSYGLVPMCRNDHYGYYSGTNMSGSVSGDNYTYSLTVYNGVKSDTALMRMLRTLGVDGLTVTTDYGANTVESFKLPINVNAIGAYGNSKAGLVTKLANPHPELLEDLRHFDGHVGETRYDAMNDATYNYDDPFIDENGASTDACIRLPEDTQFLTYKDGTAISSQANMVYAQCGGCWESIVEGGAPLFATGTQKPGGDGCSYWNFYRALLNMSRGANNPFYGLVCPNVGHDFGYGEDKDYGIDTYYAFHRYANYWLRGDDPTCEIIDVDAKNDIGIALDDGVDYIYEIAEGSAIRLQFIGQIGAEEIGKVEIVNALTGEALLGQWTSSFGGQQWAFLPTNIEENTYYRVTVPTAVMDQKGRHLAEEKSLLFRTGAGASTDADIQTEGDDTYFLFTAGNYSTSYKTTLRFTVSDANAANTMIVSAATLADGETVSDITAWDSIGEIVIIGADTYTYDVTEYMRNKTGRVAFRLSQKYAAGSEATKEFGVNASTNVNSLSYGAIGWTSISSVEAPPAEAGDGALLRVDGFTRTSSWIDLNNDLCGNYINNLSTALRIDTGISQAKLTEADLGRTFRISFRVWDTTERQIMILMRAEEGNGAYDFDNVEKTYRTKANAWTTIEFDFTVDNLDACTKYDCRQLYIYAENKSAIGVDKYAAPACNQMAQATNGAKPSGYAGVRGLNDKYTVYSTSNSAMAAGKVTVNAAHNLPFWLDTVSFTEVHTAITPASAALVSAPLTEQTLPTLGGVTLDSSDPNGAGSTTLTVSGGKQGEDTASKKVYLKLSLADYTAGESAFFSLTTSGGANRISAYGIEDAAAESWDPATITAKTAPANDIYGVGVDLSAVWRKSALYSAYVKSGDSVTLDLTDYATERKLAGCDTLTVILTASEPGTVTVGQQDFTALASADLKDYTKTTGHDKNSSQKVVTENGNSYYVLQTAHGNDAMHLSGLFENSGAALKEGDHKRWTKEDIGKSFTVTFRARTGGEAENTITKLRIGMMSGLNRVYNGDNSSYNITNKSEADPKAYGWYMYQPSADLDVTDAWQTYTYTFTVDQLMLPKSCTYKSGIVTMEAISYLGVTAIATDYNTGKNTLYIDDIVVHEGYGETVLTPVTPAGFTPVGSQDFETLTSQTIGNYTTTTGHQKDTSDRLHKYTTQTIEKDESGNSYYAFKTTSKNNAMHLSGLFETADTMKEGVHKLWSEEDVGRTFRITFAAKKTADAENTITSFRFGMMSGVNRHANPGSTWCHITTEAEANGKYPVSPADSVQYGFDMYQKSDDFTVGDTWQTYTYIFTVDELMLPKYCTYYPGQSYQKIVPEAISYFGVCPVATDYGTGKNILCIDSIVVEEIEGGVGYQTFGGIATSDLWKYTTTTGHNAKTKQTIEKDAVGNSYYVLNTAHGNDAMHLSGLFGTVQNDGSTHKLWSETDIGRSFTVTFRARKGSSAAENTITKIRFGMMAGVNREKNTGDSWCYITNEQEADGKHYGWYMYQSSADLTVTDEWQTYTYTFTVDATMLPKECSYSTGKTAMQAISYFGVTAIATNYESGDNRLLIDDILVRERPRAAIGTQSFESLKTSDLWKYTTTTGHDKNTSQTIVNENGNSSYVLKTVHPNDAMHLSGLFGTTQNSGSTHKLWSESDIGRSFTVTFRARKGSADAANTITKIRFGMMAGVNRENVESTWCHLTTKAEANGEYTVSPPDGKNYGWNMYQPSADLAVTDEWQLYTYTFTVDATMLPKNCTYYPGTSNQKIAPEAISYFGVTAIATNYTSGDNRLFIDDIRVRENDGFAGSTLSVESSASVSASGTSATLGVYGEKAERENRRYMLLPYQTAATENVKQMRLSFTLAGTNAETARLYLLTGNLPETLTWKSIASYLATPILTLTVKEGANVIDVTEFLQPYLGQKVVFVLTLDEESDPITVTTPTLTVGSFEGAAFDQSAFKVKSNITMAQDLRYNLYVPKLDVIKEIILGGVAQKLYELPVTERDGVTYYVVTKALAAKDAADSLSMQILIDTGAEKKSVTYAFSVPAYADKIVSGESFSDTTKTLMRDMLAYVDAAMTYFGTATTEKQEAIKAVLGESYALPSDSEVGLAADDVVFEKEGDAVETVSLLLEDAPAFAFKLAEGKESLADSFAFSMSGTPLKVEKRMENGRTYLVVTTYAYGMNDTLTFTYAGGNGSYNLAKYHQGTDNTALRTLTVRLAKYARSADAYKAEQA